MPTVAYRVTRKRQKFSKMPKVQAMLAEVLDSEVKPHFVAEFEKRSANWKHKPSFAARKYIRIDNIKLTVHPTGGNKKIWEYVTKGTRAHIIRPKNAPALSFMLGYKSRTGTGDKYGGPGTAGGPRVYAQEVHHPGTKAREFEKHIKEKEKSWFSRTMENAWRRIIRRL